MRPGHSAAPKENPMMRKAVLVLAGAVAVCGASGTANNPVSDYPTVPVPLTDVTFSDSFWAPRIETVRNVTIGSGSFFSDQQVQDGSRVAVLGSQIATDLFGDPAAGGTDPVGQTVRIKTSKFTVIGVATSKGGFGPENADNAIFVPLTAGQRLLAGQSSYLAGDAYH
jgi:hypothetical protein